MNRKLKASLLFAAMTLLFGCGSNTPTQPASQPPANPNAAAPAQGGAPQSASGQAPMQAPGQEPAPVAQAPAPPPEPPKPLVVKAGTVIPVVLTTALSSRTNKPGDEFSGVVASDVLVDGEVAIPKGSEVTGAVSNAKKQGAVKGEATLSVKLSSLHVRGKSYLIATSTYMETEKGKGKRSAIMTGGGAAAGALIGGLAGGGKGAAIGAGVGAGGGLAASAGTGGKNVTLPAEAKINFKLTADLTVDR